MSCKPHPLNASLRGANTWKAVIFVFLDFITHGRDNGQLEMSLVGCALEPRWALSPYDCTLSALADGMSE